MHSAVLQNKKYIKFADDNTVEVLVLSSLEKGIEKKDRKAATYKAEGPDGQEVDYLVEFPGLTPNDIFAMQRTKAASYNDTGAIPHTAIVDPFTLEKLQGIRGGTSSKKIMELAEDAQKKIRKAHGKPAITRRDLRKVDDAEAKVRKAIHKENVRKALDVVRKLRHKTKKWPEDAKKSVDAVEQIAISYATKVLDKLTELAESNAPAVRSKISVLCRKLEGTSLEERANALKAKVEGD